MLIIPAIDLKDGHCVRLEQGRMDSATVFSKEPAKAAAQWAQKGARRLHVVDLDGAVAGVPRNAALVREIAAASGGVPVQVGGGIRELDTIAAYLDAGIERVVLGTRAVREPAFLFDACAAFPQRILLGLDAREGKLATDGWEATTRESAVEFARRAAHPGLAGIVYTDIGRDGMLSGVNIEATVRLADAITIPVIASGGITNLDDIRKLCGVADHGITGAITGRAIYEGTLDFAQAQKLADELSK
jgi:phosphoribosylformimino-5-aminoimidazole carboxamide ribotide isomerase